MTADRGAGRPLAGSRGSAGKGLRVSIISPAEENINRHLWREACFCRYGARCTTCAHWRKLVDRLFWRGRVGL